ncbi:hypothetical protein B7G54_31005 [Burkholderia puraquae]|uniref:Uncharacterized protein n=1 Tax=Burkholderia puraquae TaxID=1904757 RepID=A0A1X1P8A5_9BURK|nr:hypothetical protein B7G54_31005 [Burkholderia puraquae]
MWTDLKHLCRSVDIGGDITKRLRVWILNKYERAPRKPLSCMIFVPMCVQRCIGASDGDAKATIVARI